MYRRLLTLAPLAALVLGCSSSDASGPDDNSTDTSLDINVQGAGTTQSGIMGQPTPIAPTVIVTNSKGPVAGVVVTFTVVTGGGTVSAPTVTTNADGIASVTWTLGKTFATSALEAKIPNGESVGFNATATGPDEGILAFIAADPASDTLPYTGATGALALDLTSVSGYFKRDSLLLTLTFAGGVSNPIFAGLTGLYGFIEFDMDDRVTTGDTPEANQFGATATDLGIDYFLDLFSEDMQSAVLYSHSTQIRVPATFSGNTATFHLPMSFLGGDDGEFSMVGVIGLTDRATDIMPNTGGTRVRPTKS